MSNVKMSSPAFTRHCPGAMGGSRLPPPSGPNEVYLVASHSWSMKLRPLLSHAAFSWGGSLLKGSNSKTLESAPATLLAPNVAL